MKTTVLWEKNAKKIVKTLWFLLDILGKFVYWRKYTIRNKTEMYVVGYKAKVQKDTGLEKMVAEEYDAVI